ncbi:MAG: ECF transporter S component [Clostridia bacterium]|nr:ECF transporter S component [Clostridia bacterium]
MKALIKKNTAYRISILGLLAGLTLLLGLTPIGYIPIGPANLLTLMCIPTIIGALALGYRAGMLLGLIFGVTSLITPVGLFLMGNLPLKSQIPLLATIFVPRLLVPVCARAVYCLCKGFKTPVAVAIGAVAGSLTNTVLFLGSLYFLCGADVAGMAFQVDAGAVVNILLTVAAMNGLIEAAAAAIICTPVIAALFKMKVMEKIQ